MNATPTPAPLTDGAGTVEPIPGTQFFWGDAAHHELERLFDRARDEDATGCIWVLPSSLGSWEKATELLSTDDVADMEVVIIDSGNKFGDSWKYTYYPRNKVGMFQKEDMF